MFGQLGDGDGRVVHHPWMGKGGGEEERECKEEEEQEEEEEGRRDKGGELVRLDDGCGAGSCVQLNVNAVGATG